MSAVIPAVAAAAGRAKDALEPSLRKNSRQALDNYDYDRQVRFSHTKQFFFH